MHRERTMGLIGLAIALMVCIPQAFGDDVDAPKSDCHPAINGVIWITTKDEISVSAEDPEGGLKAITTSKTLRGEPYLSVYGGRDFKLTFDFYGDAKPEGMLVMIGDGRIFDVTETMSLAFKCIHLYSYYAIVFALMPDGAYKSCSFYIGPHWKIEDAALVPLEKPLYIKPRYEERSDVQSHIDEWWESTVMRLEREKHEPLT